MWKCFMSIQYCCIVGGVSVLSLFLVLEHCLLFPELDQLSTAKMVSDMLLLG